MTSARYWERFFSSQWIPDVDVLGASMRLSFPVKSTFTRLTTNFITPASYQLKMEHLLMPLPSGCG